MHHDGMSVGVSVWVGVGRHLPSPCMCIGDSTVRNDIKFACFYVHNLARVRFVYDLERKRDACGIHTRRTRFDSPSPTFRLPPPQETLASPGGSPNARHPKTK